MNKEKEIILELTRKLLSEIWDDLSGGNKRRINQLRQNRTEKPQIINHKGKQYWIKYGETLHSFLKDQSKIKNITGNMQRGTATRAVDRLKEINYVEKNMIKRLDKKN